MREGEKPSCLSRVADCGCRCPESSALLVGQPRVDQLAANKEELAGLRQQRKSLGGRGLRGSNSPDTNCLFLFDRAHSVNAACVAVEARDKTIAELSADLATAQHRGDFYCAGHQRVVERLDQLYHSECCPVFFRVSEVALPFACSASLLVCVPALFLQ